MKYLKLFNENVNDVKSQESINNWIGKNITNYDPDDCDWNYSLSQAVDDMLHDFKTHVLDIDLTDTFENEEYLIKSFKKEWKEYYRN